MTPKQAERRARIEKAAYAVLEEVGYNSASLLTIAKRASASNETLYKWYGNKQGLFRSLVESNAREAAGMIEHALSGGKRSLDTLKDLGPVLLTLVSGERAVVLNRAAAGDVSNTGSLGRSIAEAGRKVIAPLLGRLFTQAKEEGSIRCDDPAEAVETYFHLLIGDVQIRRVIGVLDPLPQAEIDRRADRAYRQFRILYPPRETAPPSE